MIRMDRELSEAVERAVRDAERGTAAEVIVVVAARSGSYLDVALSAGFGGAMAALLVALFAPAVFRPLAVALEVPVVFGLAAWLAHRMPSLLRVLTPAARAKGQVDRAAADHFLREAVHGTRERIGVLVYVSLLEERVVTIPDLGLQGKVPPAVWHDLPWSASGEHDRPRTAADLVRGIEELGKRLAACLPARPGDLNESPDAPRFVP